MHARARPLPALLLTHDACLIWQFSRIFKRVDVCDRTTSRDLRLNVNEDLGAAGVVVGCLQGLSEFVCLCKGLRVIYGGHRSTGETRSAKRGFLGVV